MLIELIQLEQLLLHLSEKTGKLPKYLELTAETNNSKDELVDKDGKETSVETFG